MTDTRLADTTRTALAPGAMCTQVQADIPARATVVRAMAAAVDGRMAGSGWQGWKRRRPGIVARGV